MEIYEVQSAALGSGWYNCYKQQLTKEAWEPGAGDKFEDIEEPTSVQVFNMLENYMGANPEPALAKGDRMVVWEYQDCTGQILLFGMPINPVVRPARLRAEISGEYAMCNLLDKEGNEITSGLGSNIKVYFRICSPVNNDAYEASPRFIYTGPVADYMFVQNIMGTWWCMTVLNGKKDCLCQME